jgi:hypothetical protein
MTLKESTRGVPQHPKTTVLLTTSSKILSLVNASRERHIKTFNFNNKRRWCNLNFLESTNLKLEL